MYSELGGKIKELRKNKKYTLKQIAKKTELSISFLSQLERGKTSVTLDSLKKISDALGVNPSFFFSNTIDQVNSTVIRDVLSNSNFQETKFVYQNLSGDINNPLFTPLLIVLNPGDNKGNAFSHKGQEFLYVLEGTLTVQVENEEYILHPSDCIFLNSTRPHYWLNKMDKPVKFLCITATESQIYE